jgi:hypothetical protein
MLTVFPPVLRVVPLLKHTRFTVLVLDAAKNHRTPRLTHRRDMITQAIVASTNTTITSTNDRNPAENLDISTHPQTNIATQLQYTTFMGETPTPAWVYANESAKDAARDAQLAQNQMDRLLQLLVAAKVIPPEHASWVRNAPR